MNSFAFANAAKKLIFASVATLTVASMAMGNVYAQSYGGGTETRNRSFSVRKEVRFKGDNEWFKRIGGVKKGDTVEFRIRVENTGDSTVNDMKLTDFLPSETIRTGGDELISQWDNFKDGSTKTFEIEAQVKDSEFTSDLTENCVVNRAKVERFYEDEWTEVGSAAATVCYGDTSLVVRELPKTGATQNIALSMAGLGFIALGLFLKKFKLV